MILFLFGNILPLWPFLYRSQSPKFWSTPRGSKIPGFVVHCPNRSPICSTKNRQLQQQQWKHRQNHHDQKLRNAQMWSLQKNRSNLKLRLHPVPGNLKARQVLQICQMRRKLLLLRRQFATSWRNLRQKFRRRAKRPKVEATTQARVRAVAGAARKVESEIEKMAEVLTLTETSRAAANETILPINLRLENAIKRMKKFRWRHRQRLNPHRDQLHLRKLLRWPLRNSNLNPKKRCRKQAAVHHRHHPLRSGRSLLSLRLHLRLNTLIIDLAKLSNKNSESPRSFQTNLGPRHRTPSRRKVLTWSSTMVGRSSRNGRTKLFTNERTRKWNWPPSKYFFRTLYGLCLSEIY